MLGPKILTHKGMGLPEDEVQEVTVEMGRETSEKPQGQDRVVVVVVVVVIVLCTDCVVHLCFPSSSQQHEKVLLCKITGRELINFFEKTKTNKKTTTYKCPCVD